MAKVVPESDWKQFRQIREVALERFCERVLQEVLAIAQDSSQSPHARYLSICRILRDRDRELAHAFNAPRRSQMIAQLAAIHALDLLQPDEIGRFTEGTRDTIEGLVEFGR